MDEYGNIIESPIGVEPKIVARGSAEQCTVVLIESQGDDASLWRAARVCKGGGFNPDIPERDVLTKKLASLWKAKHCRCFEHARIVFGVRAPLWLIDHLRTYRAPFVSRSLRYCEPCGVFVPPRSLKKHDDPFQNIVQRAENESLKTYEALVRQGVPREEARKVLSQAVHTETILPWDLRQFFHACDERIHPAAQGTTRQVVEAMLELAELVFPCAVAGYKEARNDARS